MIFVLGYVENGESEKWDEEQKLNKKCAYEVIDRFNTVDSVDRAFNELKEYWDYLLSAYVLESLDPKLNRMVNIWNQYQCMITFCFSRSVVVITSINL